MKNIIVKLTGSLMITILIASCSVLKNTPVVYEIDPVCHMKVDKSEAYTFKYKGVEYYFDNINCQKTFKMDPEVVLKKNSCEPKK